jgi:hypothetical protein
VRLRKTEVEGRNWRLFFSRGMFGARLCAGVKGGQLGLLGGGFVAGDLRHKAYARPLWCLSPRKAR